jgi:pescadillo protein
VEEVEPKAVSKSKGDKQDKENEDEEEVNDGRGDADSSSEESVEEDVAKIQAQKKAANTKLKRDLQKEQQEMAKVLLTNRQRKLYQKAEEEQNVKKDAVKKLRAKRRVIEKKM